MSKAATCVKLRSEGRCRLCGRSSDVRPLTRHRVVPGALGGPYVSSNVVPLCRPCHDLVDNLDPEERLGYRRMLRAALWPEEVAYAYARLRGWFDDLYPRTSREYVLRFRRGERPAIIERPRLVRLPRRSGMSGWVAVRPVHRKGCHPAYGCVAGCPVVDVYGAVGTADRAGYAARA